MIVSVPLTYFHGGNASSGPVEVFTPCNLDKVLDMATTCGAAAGYGRMMVTFVTAGQDPICKALATQNVTTGRLGITRGGLLVFPFATVPHAPEEGGGDGKPAQWSGPFGGTLLFEPSAADEEALAAAPARLFLDRCLRHFTMFNNTSGAGILLAMQKAAGDLDKLRRVDAEPGSIMRDLRSAMFLSTMVAVAAADRSLALPGMPRAHGADALPVLIRSILSAPVARAVTNTQWPVWTVSLLRAAGDMRLARRRYSQAAFADQDFSAPAPRTSSASVAQFLAGRVLVKVVMPDVSPGPVFVKASLSDSVEVVLDACKAKWDVAPAAIVAHHPDGSLLPRMVSLRAPAPSLPAPPEGDTKEGPPADEKPAAPADEEPAHLTLRELCCPLLGDDVCAGASYATVACTAEEKSFGVPSSLAVDGGVYMLVHLDAKPPSSGGGGAGEGDGGGGGGGAGDGDDKISSGDLVFVDVEGEGPWPARCTKASRKRLTVALFDGAKDERVLTVSADRVRHMVGAMDATFRDVNTPKARPRGGWTRHAFFEAVERAAEYADEHDAAAFRSLVALPSAELLRRYCASTRLVTWAPPKGDDPAEWVPRFFYVREGYAMASRAVVGGEHDARVVSVNGRYVPSACSKSSLLATMEGAFLTKRKATDDPATFLVKRPRTA